MPLPFPKRSALAKASSVRSSHDERFARKQNGKKAAFSVWAAARDWVYAVCGCDRRRVAHCLALLLCLQGALAVSMVTHSPRYALVSDAGLRIYFCIATAACAAAITLIPALLALLQPRRGATRIALGASQALMGGLLFYLRGRHIELHDAVVGAVAVIGFNTDWLIPVCTAGTYAVWSANSQRADQDCTQGNLDERQKVLATKLARALQEGVLSLVYQPIFRDDEQMIAVEALARWSDPQEGFISPAEFIPVAEVTGLIIPLSEWVLREACGHMVQWIAIDPRLERLAVNVSVKHIWRADFVHTVESILKETCLSPHHLELEVTESALATDFVTVKRHLAALRRLGIRISIDDFGTGYSSLNRVRELDADTLKVDRCFVQSASETASGVAVVQAIIDMGHSLKLSVIAEGVETQEQMSMLRGMRCDCMQGFLLARPQAAEVITATLYTSAAAAMACDMHRPIRLSTAAPHTIQPARSC